MTTELNPSSASQPLLRQPTRIAYLAFGIGGAADGVRDKILTQAAAWSAASTSVSVGIFVRGEAGSDSAWLGSPNLAHVRSSRSGLPGRVLARERLIRDVARWRPD